MKTTVLTFLIIFAGFGFKASGQAPVANDDHAEALVHETVSIRVLDNDSSYNNNPIRIPTVSGQGPASIAYNDSLVFYTPNTFTQGVDVLQYRILDIQTNLLSQVAKIYVEVTNHGIAILDKNQVNCRIIAGGMQFNSMYTNEDGYEVPAGEGAYTVYSKSFYIGGYDDEGQLYLAGENYKWNVADFFPGPVSDTIIYTQDYDIGWHKVWKLDREEIDYHRANWQQPGYEPIENISDWPGNGNPAEGQANLLAPFYDLNSDGIYNPLNGDFPLIKGDQSILTIYNDDREHTESGGKKLGVEIQAMYYAYDQPDDSALSQTIFGSKTIINRSQKDYYDAYAAFFIDFMIGYAWDNYIGCDTLLHSAFAYNGLPIDGVDQPEAFYGAHPPAQSFTCLNFDMDSFIYYYSSSVSPQPETQTPPQNATEFYNYMKSIWRDGTPLTFGGTGYGGEVPVSYAFPGNPVTNEGWTEQSAGILPGHRRGLVTTGPFNFLSGDTLVFDFALVFARDYQGDHLSSVALLKNRINYIRDYYLQALSVDETPPDNQDLKVYPNPFKSELLVETNSFTKAFEWMVIDMFGKTLLCGKSQPELMLKLDLKSLDNGIYLLRLNDGKQQGTVRIIKTR
jgi:hypothetical protein